MKKLLSIIVCLAMVFALASTAFASASEEQFGGSETPGGSEVPDTGDSILMAVAALAVSGTALLILLLRKKKQRNGNA